MSIIERMHIDNWSKVSGFDYHSDVKSLPLENKQSVHTDESGGILSMDK
ncbi:MAG: hypothetical protein HQL06_16765 [Nitrospirae bacterium]|nr:hypothetical protein [Nitrospirota bacterium]